MAAYWTKLAARRLPIDDGVCPPVRCVSWGVLLQLAAEGGEFSKGAWPGDAEPVADALFEKLCQEGEMLLLVQVQVESEC